MPVWLEQDPRPHHAKGKLGEIHADIGAKFIFTGTIMYFFVSIQGSISLPYTQTTPDAMAKLVPDKLTPVVFYCDGLSCPHSMKAIKKAVSYGFVNIFWFRGGISEWTKKGFPITNN